MITSFFPGRIRLREEVFKDPIIVEEAIKILKSSDAIKSVENNYRTGSVLLEYEPSKVPMDKLKPLIPFFEELRKLTVCYSEKKRPELLAKLKEFEKIVSTW